MLRDIKINSRKRFHKIHRAVLKIKKIMLFLKQILYERGALERKAQRKATDLSRQFIFAFVSGRWFLRLREQPAIFMDTSYTQGQMPYYKEKEAS